MTLSSSTEAAKNAVAPSGDAGASREWLSQPERGALLGIQLVFWLATLFGRWPARQLVRLIAAWYWVFDRKARAASRTWLSVVLEREPTQVDIYKHLQSFAQVTLDRVFLLKGKTSPFVVTRTGNHYLEALTAKGQGALLLGAHLGSFEAMRVGGKEEDFDITIVGNFANAKMINSLLDRLDPAMRARVIDIGDDPLATTLSMQATVEKGGMIAILGDRVAGSTRYVEVDFFGKPARFPAGPFILASLMQCPVYLVFGLYQEPNRYDLHCEVFAERLVFPRASRQQSLQQEVQRYAHAVERYARQAPYCWFNFYDFWEKPEA